MNVAGLGVHAKTKLFNDVITPFYTLVCMSLKKYIFQTPPLGIKVIEGIVLDI